MSDGQSDYHRMYSSPLGREYEAAARKTAAASTRIWETPIRDIQEIEIVIRARTPGLD